MQVYGDAWEWGVVPFPNGKASGIWRWRLTLPLPLGLFIALNGNIRPVSYIQQMVIPHKSVKVNLTIRNRPYAGLSLLKV